MKRKNIRDVAREANVSISTVSHALNETRYVKEETKQKIKKIAKKLNYRPSAIAKGLRKKSINTVAIFVANIESQFFSKVTMGINKIANANNYHTIMVNTFYDEDEEEKIIESLRNQFIDGAIFVSGLNNVDCIKKLDEEKFPFVLVTRKINDRYPSILIDNMKAMEETIDYLANFGHRKIGYLTMDYQNRQTVTERFLGYKKGLKKNKLGYDSSIVLIGENKMIDEMKKGYILVRETFRNKEAPTAMIAATDNLAAGAYTAFKELDLKIPQDISIVGFDNLPMSRFLDPPLTTIKQPKEKLGSCAMEMLIKLIRSEEIRQNIQILDTAITERGSVTYPSK